MNDEGKAICILFGFFLCIIAIIMNLVNVFVFDVDQNWLMIGIFIGIIGIFFYIIGYLD